MWTKYILAKSTANSTSWKHEHMKTNTRKKKIPPPSAVGFTHSGDEAPLVNKKKPTI
jgi:hypothetical protein